MTPEMLVVATIFETVKAVKPLLATVKPKKKKIEMGFIAPPPDVK